MILPRIAAVTEKSPKPNIFLPQNKISGRGEPVRFISEKNRELAIVPQTQLRFIEIAGTNATDTHLDSFDSAVVIDFDVLKVDFKSTFDIFDHVHTDTAGLLRQTLTGDAAAIGFGLAAHCANFTHFFLTFPHPLSLECAATKYR